MIVKTCVHFSALRSRIKSVFNSSVRLKMRQSYEPAHVIKNNCSQSSDLEFLFFAVSGYSAGSHSEFNDFVCNRMSTIHPESD